jgi:hypothetical protein
LKRKKDKMESESTETYIVVEHDNPALTAAMEHLAAADEALARQLSGVAGTLSPQQKEILSGALRYLYYAGGVEDNSTSVYNRAPIPKLSRAAARSSSE